jgi:hypothetical protein
MRNEVPLFEKLEKTAKLLLPFPFVLNAMPPAAFRR